MNKLFLSYIPAIAFCALMGLTTQAKEVAHFSMDLRGDKISESVSGRASTVEGVLQPENIAGAKGQALRLDGYSSFVDADLDLVIPAGSKKMTASVWVALQTYPVVELDVNTSEQVAIASCLDDTAKTGFGFFVGIDGKYSFKTYLGG